MSKKDVETVKNYSPYLADTPEAANRAIAGYFSGVLTFSVRVISALLRLASSDHMGKPGPKQRDRQKGRRISTMRGAHQSGKRVGRRQRRRRR